MALWRREDKSPSSGGADRGPSLTVLPLETQYLPTERLRLPRTLDDAKHVGESPVLMAMLDSSPGMVALLNPDRRIVYCNDGFLKAGGLACKGDALGLQPGEILRCIHSEETPGGCGASGSCCHCGLDQALSAGRQGHANAGEFYLECRDRRRNLSAEFAVDVRPVPKLGAGWQCMSLTDISGEKRREALERSFFHDIMNRACAVKTVSEALGRDDIAAESRADLMTMLSASANALVDEIQSHCTLRAAENGELAVKSANCDSREALQAAVDACRAFGFAEDKQLEILPGTLSLVFKTDATLLGRILINLLKNALEASAPDQLVTATCSELRFPHRVILSVHNQGAMAENVRAHIFQRSFSTKGPGRGLGTYSVRLLAESMGGRTWFASTEAGGTTFHVEFSVSPV